MPNRFFLLLQRAKLFLTRRQATWLCCGVAVMAKSVLAFFYSDLDTDKALYLLLSDGFLKTGAFVEQVNIFETGAPAFFYDPGILSPLYSMLAVPLLWLTNSFFITQLVLSILGWLLFMTGLYCVASLTFFHRWQANLFILFAGFFLYIHEDTSGPKDTLAIGFTLWAIVLSYRFLTRSRPSVRLTICLALCLCCIALVKLLYVSLAAFLLSALLVVLLVKHSRPHWFRAGILLTILTIVGLLTYQHIFYPAQQFATANTIRLPNDARPVTNGFYPANVAIMHPFISAAFINHKLWGVQIEKLAGISYSTVMNAFRVLDALLLCGLLAIYFTRFRWLLRRPLILLLASASFVMVAVIGWLTIREKLVVNPFTQAIWNFGVDGRSFLLPMLTLQLLCFWYLFGAKGNRLAKGALACLVGFAFFYGLYFDAKLVATTPWKREPLAYSPAERTITTFLQRPVAGRPPALVTTKRVLRRFAQVHGLPVYSFSNQPVDTAWIKGKTFLVATYPTDSVFRAKLHLRELAFTNSFWPLLLHRFAAD